MTISYAITVCNELVEIHKLVDFLIEHKRPQDSITILLDASKDDCGVETYLRSHSVNAQFAWHKGTFNNHFADWKNKLTSLCTGDYVFQIDADEIPNATLIHNLPGILEENPDCDVFLIPRINTVKGLTDNHVKQWGWKVDENGWVNWPDYQWRIYKKKPEIKWINKVHETLDGHMAWTALPDMEELALYHHKEINRQEKQNKLYSTLQ